MTPTKQAILSVFDTIENNRQRTGYYVKQKQVLMDIPVGNEVPKANIGDSVTHSHNLRPGCSYTGPVIEIYKQNGYVYTVIRRDYVTIDGNTRPCSKKEQNYTDTVRLKDLH